MQSSLPRATKAQQARFRLIQEIGCWACLLRTGRMGTPCEIHHLLDGGRRISHDHTVGLCEWHHRGVVPMGFSQIRVYKQRGPSMARAPKAFHDQFGDDELLLRGQNIAIECYQELGDDFVQAFHGLVKAGLGERIQRQ